MPFYEFDDVKQMFDFLRKAEEGYLKDHTVPPILPGTYWLCQSQPGMNIYGISQDSEYEEDREVIEDARTRGYIFGEWFSAVCPYPDGGELGSNHISNCTAITEEFFMLNVPRSDK